MYEMLIIKWDGVCVCVMCGFVFVSACVGRKFLGSHENPIFRLIPWQNGIKLPRAPLVRNWTWNDNRIDHSEVKFMTDTKEIGNHEV